MQERRQFVRLNANVNVTWSKIDDFENGSKRGIDITRNISSGGICLMMEEPVHGDDILELTIELPTHKVIQSRGRVVWVSEFEIVAGEQGKRYDAGIEFLDIDEHDREAIKEFVFTFLPREDT